MSRFELDLGSATSSSYISAVSAPLTLPQIKNVVATLNVQCALDLKDIVTKSRNAEYNPKRFAAVIMRIREPQSTALMFASGKVVITGASTEDNAYTCALKYVRILQKLEFAAMFEDFKVVNVVGCCDCGFPVRLESLAHFKSEFCSYEPELFPGLIYRMRQPMVVLLVFVSGKVVLTGAKSKAEIDQSFKLIWPILLKFRKVHNLEAVGMGDGEGDEEDMDYDEDDDMDAF